MSSLPFFSLILPFMSDVFMMMMCVIATEAQMMFELLSIYSKTIQKTASRELHHRGVFARRGVYVCVNAPVEMFSVCPHGVMHRNAFTKLAQLQHWGRVSIWFEKAY